MLRILLKQPLNFFRNLEIRYNLELITLIIIVFTVFGSQLSIAFEKWINGGGTNLGISLLISNLFSLQISFSSLAIITWLIPRQKGLRTLLVQPLDSKSTIKVLLFYSLKYLSLYIILLLPVLAAMISKFNLLSTLISVMIVLGSGLFFLFSLFWLRNKFNSKLLFLILGTTFITIYHVGFSIFYWLTNQIVIYQAIMVSLFLLFSAIIYFSKAITIDLGNFVPFQIKVYKKKILKKSATKRPQLFPKTIQALFEKEYYSLWRNAKYKKLKLITLLMYFLTLIALILNNPEYHEIWLTAVICLFIWIHYSSGFNEKYTFPEPTWFIRTQPIKFRHLFLAKYFSELPTLIITILTAIIFFNFQNIQSENSSFLLFFIVVFAHFVLFSMLNFQIMFFDNARLAGYAFHFSIIFLTIMIINYHLVGPLIALSLMLFFFYKNIKFLNK